MVLTSFISFVVCPLAAENMFTAKGYPSVAEKRRHFVHTFSSTVHSVFVSGVGVYLLATGGFGNNSRPDANIFLMQVTLAHYIVDTIAHMLDKKLRDTSQIPMHHTGAGLAIVVLILSQWGEDVMCVRILSHSSTVFKNVFYIFRSFKLKDSPWFVLVSVVLVLATLVTRVAPTLCLWEKSYIHIFVEMYVPPWPLVVSVSSIAFLFDIFNLLVAYKMIKGLGKYVMYHYCRS